MSRTLGSLVFAAGLVFVALSSTGCKQGEGDRCEIDSDCSAGLMCNNPSLTGGVCSTGKSETTPDAATADAAPAAADTSVTPDQAPASPDVAAVTDTAPATSDAHTDAVDSSSN
jgi:hypothetical protein